MRTGDKNIHTSQNNWKHVKTSVFYKFLKVCFMVSKMCTLTSDSGKLVQIWSMVVLLSVASVYVTYCMLHTITIVNR